MTSQIKLPSRLDLSAAQVLMGDLRQADLSGEVLLDAEDVIHFGALCTQTIMAASVAAKEAGGKIKLTNVNDKATGQLGLMGLSPESLTEVS